MLAPIKACHLVVLFLQSIRIDTFLHGLVCTWIFPSARQTRPVESPAVVRSLGGDWSVRQMNPWGLLRLLLDPLVVLSYPRLLLLENNVDSYNSSFVSI